MFHRYLPSGDIQDHFWNEERVKTGSAIAMGKIDHFILEGGQTADTAGKYYPYPVYIHVLFADTGILHRHITCGECQLRKTVGFAGLFPVHELRRIESFYFTG